MANNVKVREAHDQNLGETGYLHLDGRWITSISKHPAIVDMFRIELARTRDDRARSLVEHGSTMIEYTPDAAPEPAPATDAPMSDFVELLLKQQNATPEQRQAVRDSLSKAKTDAAAVSGYEGIPPAALYQNWCDTSDLLRKAEERAERAEAALTDVGARLEIADTRNTDMVLALERAEAALAEAKKDAVGLTVAADDLLAENKRLREVVSTFKRELSAEYGDFEGDINPAIQACFDALDKLDASEGGAW